MNVWPEHIKLIRPYVMLRLYSGARLQVIHSSVRLPHTVQTLSHRPLSPVLPAGYCHISLFPSWGNLKHWSASLAQFSSSHDLTPRPGTPCALRLRLPSLWVTSRESVRSSALPQASAVLGIRSRTQLWSPSFTPLPSPCLPDMLCPGSPPASPSPHRSPPLPEPPDAGLSQGGPLSSPLSALTPKVDSSGLMALNAVSKLKALTCGPPAWPCDLCPGLNL